MMRQKYKKTQIWDQARIWTWPTEFQSDAFILWAIDSAHYVATEVLFSATSKLDISSSQEKIKTHIRSSQDSNLGLLMMNSCP